MQYLLQKREFIKELDIHPSTLRLFIKEGLPILKPTHEVTLIDLQEVVQWLELQSSPKRKELKGVVTELILSKAANTNKGRCSSTHPVP